MKPLTSSTPADTGITEFNNRAAKDPRIEAMRKAAKKERKTTMVKKSTNNKNLEKARNALPKAVFMALWETSDSLWDFLERAGEMGIEMKDTTAKARAARYRAGGKRTEPVALKFLDGELTDAERVEQLIKAGDTKGLQKFLKTAV